MGDHSCAAVNDGVVVFMLYSSTEVKGKAKSDELPVVKNGWDFAPIEWFRNGLSWIASCCQNCIFWFCRSQEPVSMWEESGSWYKNQGDGILGCWEPVTPGEEPGSQFKICKETNNLGGNQFPVWKNRVPHSKIQRACFEECGNRVLPGRN